MSWNIDIPQSLNSHDSFPRRKVENRAQTSCNPDPILSPTNISFELHAKVAEETDLEMCSYGQLRKFKCSVTLTLDRVKVTSTYTVRVGLPAQPCDCSITQYQNMAIWILWNMDIWRSLNSRDSFPRRKFKNRAQKSCSPGPILSPPTISFELHEKMVEIDLEKCNFGNFGSSMTLTLTLDWVEVTLVHICGWGLPTHQIKSKSKKLFADIRTDTHWPKNQNI